MLCSVCGKENADTVVFCSACGNRFSAQVTIVQKTDGDFPESGQALKKSSVLLLILLTIITAGIYNPVWFLIRKDAINDMQSKEKLNSGGFIIAIIVYSISLLLFFISCVCEGLGEIDTARGIELFYRFLDLVVSIYLLIQCLKIRRIFNEHFNVKFSRNIYFSGLATFFSIYIIFNIK